MPVGKERSTHVALSYLSAPEAAIWFTNNGHGSVPAAF